MDNITVSAKTYDEAITKAMIQLQTTREHLVVEVMEKGTSGFLGIGGRRWTIRVHVKSEEEEQAEALADQEKKKAAERETAEKEETLRKEAAENARSQEKTSHETFAGENAVNSAAESEEPVSDASVEEDAESSVETESSDEQQADQDTGRMGQRNSGRRQRSSRNRRDPRDGRKPEGRRPGSGTREQKSEKPVGREVPKEEADEIAERAVAFLNSIFQVMEEKISIDTDFNYQDNELGITLSGDDMGILIGKRGQTLDSIQYLVSLVVNKHRDVYIRVKLDTENYRERREAKLKSLARNIAHKVKQTRRPVSLEPMNPYERRIIHSALQRDPYVTTYSEGEDPYRHIVVILKKDYKKSTADQGGEEKRTE